MFRRALQVSFACAVLAMQAAGAKEAPSDPIQDRITFESGSEKFDEIFPVTENLNNILAQISRMEAEKGRAIPNFIVYPYETDAPMAEPFALVWRAGQYARVNRVRANQEAYVIYDPRRLSVSEVETENGEHVEYRHFVIRCEFNKMPEQKDGAARPGSPMEPTGNSVFISRAIVSGPSESEGGPVKIDPTHQVISFPRISVPKEIDGEDVKKISFQFESLLNDEDQQPESEKRKYPDASSFPVD